MSTKTTNFELIKPELTDPADITAFNGNWDKIDEQLGKVSEGASKSVVVNAILNAANWNSGIYTWSNSNIKSATQIIELLPSQSITSDQLTALQGANIVGTSQAVGSVTFKAYGEVPTISIPVIFVIRGDV